MTIVIREALPADADLIMNLVLMQYGRLNYDPLLYDRGGLTAAIGGDYRFWLAFAEENGCEKPAGMVCLKAHTLFEGTFEGCTLMVLPQFRGHGLAARLMDSMRRRFDSLPNAASVFYSVLTTTTLEQDREYKNGFIPTGLALNRFLYDRSAENLTGVKLPSRRHHIFMCKALQKHETPKLYIPAEVEDIIRGIYRDLGVIIGSKPTADQINIIIPYPEHHYTEYYGCVPEGFDFDRNGYVNFFLDMTLPSCPSDFDKLKKAGFVFTGTKPLQTAAEYVIMHYSPGEAKPAIEETITLTAFDGIKNRLLRG
jgi:GNAT superfamily N-acetyltransferase